ncbi:hypothetical protein [Saccharopolyspora pogona]|uniref:hypothetical protein n=1 Tax=Saccharopolyspora pogona TaxID=333966 RepID=UPI00168591A0|nr:hypothetical protein [Saccharopolyspora pogona]
MKNDDKLKSKDLPLLLLKSSQGHARRAIAIYQKRGSSENEIALHCGMAVEHLAKYILALINTALLQENKADEDSLLFLCGAPLEHSKKVSEIRTIGAEDACKRVQKIYPGIGYSPTVGATLFGARNSAAHLGVADLEDAYAALYAAMLMIKNFLPKTRIGWEGYWGEESAAASTLLNEEEDNLRARYVAKITAAEQRFAAQYSGISEDARSTVLKIVLEHPRANYDHKEKRACPACNSFAWLGFDLKTDFEADFERDGTPIGVVEVTTATPKSFDCPACGLLLSDIELEFADMDGEVYIEEKDIRDTVQFEGGDLDF